MQIRPIYGLALMVSCLAFGAQGTTSSQQGAGKPAQQPGAFGVDYHGYYENSGVMTALKKDNPKQFEKARMLADELKSVTEEVVSKKQGDLNALAPGEPR